MAKYSERLVDKMIKLIEEDTYTITDICNILNISRKSFYQWRETKPEFDKAIADAMEMREEKLVAKARLSLQKKLEGYTLTETKLKYIPDEEDPTQLKLEEKIVKVKEYAPDNKAIQIVMDRTRPNNKPAAEGKNTIIHITVPDENTREQLEILQKRLQRNTA